MIKIEPQKIDDMIQQQLYVAQEHDHIKNDIYLTEQEKSILTFHGLNYEKYASLNELLFDIEDLLREEESDELEQVSKDLAEFHYYHNTRK